MVFNDHGRAQLRAKSTAGTGAVACRVKIEEGGWTGWGRVRIWNACGNQYYLTGGSRQLAARPGRIRHLKMHTFTARGCAGSAMLRLGRYETVKAGIRWIYSN
jgi:hypothetical protein